LTILCALAFGVWLRPEAIPCRGITELDPMDFRLAGELGYAVKLLGACRRDAGGLEAFVQPALVPAASLLGRVKGVFNAVQLQGDMVGDMLFYGRGAGPAPTASAVLADLVGIVRGERFPVLAWAGETSVLPLGETTARFFLRLQPAERSAGKAAIERLRALGIEVAASRSEEGGQLALLTGATSQRAVAAAAADLASVPSIRGVSVPLRVVD
jgi:homoserine dehydrogenase